LNNIHNNSDTHSMSSIDQLLQLIRSTETGRSGKEIYECHIGMAQQEEKVGSYNEFREKVLPRIAKEG